MTTDDARRRPLQGKVDFTLMYAVHDAFHRDLRCLTAAVEAGRTADPAVRAGWATFKNQLHVHHTAEDASLWPPLRQQVTRPDETAALDAMEAEHARIDPLLSQVDASLAASGHAGLAIPARHRLRTVTADVLDAAAISPAVDGEDAVISAVGPGTGASTLRQDSTRSIIQAMQKTGTRRLLIVSGPIVRADPSGGPTLPAVFRELDAVAVLAARLLPAP